MEPTLSISQLTGTLKLTFARMSATHWCAAVSEQPTHELK